MTIFKKSLLTLSAAVLAFSMVLIIFSMIFMNALYYELNTAGLKNTAKTLYSSIGESRITQIFLSNSVSEPLYESSEYRLTLIDPSGYVLWDSHVTDGLVNHIDREEVAAALQGKEASARRNSISRGNQEIYYALPVLADRQILGVFRLSVSVPSFGMRISPIIPPFIIYSCLLAVAAFLAIFAYSKSLAGSVGRLVSIAQFSAPMLSGTEANTQIAPEFRSLEKAMRAMTGELTMRFEQAKEEGARLEAILNGMSEAVFAMDSELLLHLVNPRAKELFNIKQPEVNKLSLLEATRSCELEDIAKKVLETKTPIETELILRTSDTAEDQTGNLQLPDLLRSQLPGGSGQDRHFLVKAAKLAKINENGALKDTRGGGVVLVLQDITRLVKLERVRKDFVANVSHELRTPIQLIKGFSETLLDVLAAEGRLNADNGNQEQITRFIEIIQKNAGTMENLTNDLLMLADLENKGINSRDMEELNILNLIEEAVSSLHLQAKRKNIEIVTKCSENIKAKLYGSLIVQALVNLIDNAIKYSRDKSTVWISAAIEDCKLVLEVRDNGIGIPKEHQQRIFERFYRVDKARANTSGKEAGGTGLGLSIVRHIALLHNGKTEVESRAGEGSVFRIIIPA